MTTAGLIRRIGLFISALFVLTTINVSFAEGPHSSVNGYGCDSCHDVNSSQDKLIPDFISPGPTIDETLSNNMCWSCHNPLGDAPPQAPLTEIQTHSSLVTDASYGQWSVECSVCHSQHNEQQATGAARKKLIRKNIDLSRIIYADATPPKSGNRTVIFENLTGAKSFADGDATIDGICEVCHTQTSHWRNDGTLAGVGVHDGLKGSNCMTCHPHGEGFKADCGTCHAFPPVNPGGLVSLYDSGTPGSTGSGTAGAHNEHTANQAIGCDACHYNNTAGFHNDGLPLDVTIGFGPNAPIPEGGDYNGQVGVQYDATVTAPVTNVVVNPVADGNNKQCSNIYCHGNYAGSGLNATPVWDVAGSGDCGTCHDASNVTGNTPASGSHTKHVASNNVGTYNRGYECTLCHNGLVSGTGPDTYAIADITKHVDGYVDWVFNSSDNRLTADSVYNVAAGSQSPTDGNTGAGNRAFSTCNNIYCHSIAQTATGGALTADTADYKTPAWGASVTCGACHNQDGSHSVGSTMDSGSHTAHLAYTFTTTMNAMKCELCHRMGTAAITSNSDCSTCHSNGERTDHVDGEVDIVFEGTITGAGTYDGTKAPGDGFGSCASTYCHSDGTSVSTGTVAANTASAWGTPGPLACSSCHGNGPAYTNGTPKANSHSKHVSGGLSCDVCHFTTTTDGTSIASKSAHVNQVYDVSPGTGVTFNYTPSAVQDGSGGSCDTTYCHGAGSPQWGGTVNCGDCHTVNNTLAGSHATHYGLAAAGDWNSDNNSTTGASGVYAFNCTNCHDNTAGGTAHGDGAVAAPQTANIFFDTATYGTGGSTYTAGALAGTDNNFQWSAGTCNTIYCHSDGTSVSTGTVTANPSPPVWGAGALTCNACHGNGPAYANGTPKANSHGVHIAAGYGCEDCHAATTTTGNTITDRTKHVNKTYDVAPGGGITFTYTPSAVQDGSGGTCATVSCHGNAGGTWGADMHNFTPTADCATCHGSPTPGTSNARDAVTAPYTVTGEVHSASGCATCHDTGANGALKGSAFGNATATECIDCHAVSWSAIHTGATGMDHSTRVDGLAACVTCHDATAGGASGLMPVNPATPAGDKVHDACTVCHTGNNDGALNTGNTTYGGQPIAKGDCGTCHTSTYFDNHTHHYTANNQVAFDAAVDVSQNNDVPGNACNVCHMDDTDASTTPLDSFTDILGEHVTGCARCHSYTEDADLTPSEAEVAAAIATAFPTPVNCVTCHVKKDHASGASSEHGGHTASHFKWDGGCIDCHADSGNGLVIDVHSNDCTICHTGTPNRNSEKIGDAANGVDGNALLADGTAVAANWANVGCLTCHPSATYSKEFIHHDRATTAPDNCTTCHNTTNGHNGDHQTLVVGIANSCSSCHTATAPTDADNVPVNATDAKIHDACSQCHFVDTDNFVKLVTPSGSVTTMDDPSSPPWNNAGGTCTECHTTYFNSHSHSHSFTLTTACANCHDNVDPAQATSNARNAAAAPFVGALEVHGTLACATCHDLDATPTGSLISLASGKSGTLGCVDCHTSDWVTSHTGAPGMDHTTRVDGLAACITCHDATAGGSGGSMPLNAATPAGDKVHDTCTVCHTGANDGALNGGTTTYGGQALAKGTCGTCHTSTYFDSHVHGQDGGYVDHVISYNATNDLSQVSMAGDNPCGDCHNGNNADGNGVPLNTWTDIASEHNSSCAICHNYTAGTTPPFATVASLITNNTTSTCVTCHTPKDEANGTSSDHGGHDASHFAWDSNCQDCHGAGSGTEAVVAVIHGNNCDLCHTGGTYNAGTNSAGPSTNGIDGDAGQAEGDAGAGNWGSTCTTCHDPNGSGTSVNAASYGGIHHDNKTDGTNPITNGSFNCTSKCHNVTNHEGNHTTLIANSTADNSSCIECHDSIVGGGAGVGAPTSAADNMVHDTCQTCHVLAPVTAADGQLKTAYGRAQDIPDGGAGTDNGGGPCLSCHSSYQDYSVTNYDETENTVTTFGGNHHDTTQAQAGTCTYCHDDPRGAAAATVGSVPNVDWETAYSLTVPGTLPTQLACRLCHANYNETGNNDLVIAENWFSDGHATGGGVYDSHTAYDNTTKLWDNVGDYDLNGKEPRVRKQIVHEITATGGKINVDNYGICLGCHDGGKATVANVWHARQKYTEGPEFDDDTQDDNFHFDVLRNAPGRDFFGTYRGSGGGSLVNGYATYSQSTEFYNTNGADPRGKEFFKRNFENNVYDCNDGGRVKRSAISFCAGTQTGGWYNGSLRLTAGVDYNNVTIPCFPEKSDPEGICGGTSDPVPVLTATTRGGYVVPAARVLPPIATAVDDNVTDLFAGTTTNVDVLANDSGPGITITNITQPTCNVACSIAIAGGGASIDFTAAAGFTGTTVAATYTITDSNTNTDVGNITFTEGSGVLCSADRSGTEYYIDANNYDSIGSNNWTDAGTYLTATAGNNTGAPAGTPAQYFVDFTESGNYYVWIYGYATGTGDNSLWYGENGTSEGNMNMGTTGTWAWTNTRWDTGPDPMALNVNNTGIRPINIWKREAGFDVQGILITSDAAFTPSGWPPTASEIDPTQCPNN